MTWRGDLAASLERRRKEADGDALRLGHKLCGWLALPTRKYPARFQARCWNCDELAVVHADGHSGVALILRCRPLP